VNDLPVAAATAEVSRPRMWRGPLALALALTFAAGTAIDAASAACKPRRPKPQIVLKDLGLGLGACSFDQETMKFAGEPLDQAKCLMRGVNASRNLVPVLETLPEALTSRIGTSTGLPPREALSALLSNQNLEWDFAANLWMPVARANDNGPTAPEARYFVLHDTSGPNYGRRAFPADIDVSPRINNLANFRCSDGWELAHVIVNRSGGMLRGHDFGEPWRATKFERAVNFNGALKGLFLHVEMIQPRRAAKGRGRRNDAEAPTPGFTLAQYNRVALLYTIASVRAQTWLIPAYHAAIDSGIRGGHDDPLNFEIERFAESLDTLIAQLRAGNRQVAATDGTATPSAPAAEDITATIGEQ
jgi:hypothetical protein